MRRYFSWDEGLVHYVAISTELYSEAGSVGTGVDVLSQHRWLTEDLARANANRAKVPWIVVHGHRSIYCSCDKDCDAGAALLRDGPLGLEELFMDHGVDLFLNGHEHNCETRCPPLPCLSGQTFGTASAVCAARTAASDAVR